MRQRGKFTVLVVAFQVSLIVVYALFVEYGEDVDASRTVHSLSEEKGGQHPNDNSIALLDPLFQDVHAMIFFGIGFLYTFMRKYAYTGLGMNMLMASLAVEWAIIIQNIWHMKNGKILIDIYSMIGADFATAAVLISFGGVVGKLCPLQLVLFTIIEIVIYVSNDKLCQNVFKFVDIGGSVTLHAFAAFYGLSVSFVLYRKGVRDHPKEAPSYNNDVFTMVGTVFLWVFWPSFNAALIKGDDQHRAVLNTFLGLISSCIITFAMSSIFDKKGRFSMTHIQNATLAGGVSLGSAANLMIHPFGALVLGTSGGCISCLGYKYITPFLTRHCRIHDTGGISSLHAIPGLLSGMAGVLLASIASEQDYGYSLYEIYPGRAPPFNTTQLASIQEVYPVVQPGYGWSGRTQAIYQLIGIGTSLAVSIVGGLVTGVLLLIPQLDPPTDEELYDDKPFWILPKEDGVIKDDIVVMTITNSQNTKM